MSNSEGKIVQIAAVAETDAYHVLYALTDSGDLWRLRRIPGAGLDARWEWIKLDLPESVEAAA